MIATWVANVAITGGQFRLYRGNDGNAPRLIAQMAVQIGEQSYRFEDESVCNGKCYYQLRYTQPGAGEAILKTVFCRETTVDPDPAIADGFRHDRGVHDISVGIEHQIPTDEVVVSDLVTGSWWRPPPLVPPPRFDGPALV